MIRKKILVISEDEAFLGPVDGALQTAGFKVTIAADEAEARRQIAAQGPDLIILDLGSQAGESTDVFHDVRGNFRGPIIGLTARGQDTDQMVGLELGADDHVITPFSPGEMVARAKAIFRRLHPALASRGAEPTVLDGLGVTMDLRAHKVLVSGRAVSLTPTEYRLLATLMRHRGEVVSPHMLLEDVWDYGEYDTHLVEVHIANLRHKVEADPHNPHRIQTIRSLGYRFG